MPEETAGVVGPRRRALGELAWVFLRLGTIAFGGPAAHIAMFEQEIVRRRGWLTEAEFLDRLGAASLIPGPTSTELVVHIGHRRAGWPGLLVAGSCFILPAAVSVCLLAALYVHYGRLPAVAGLLYAIKPVVIAIILQALWNFRRTALRTRWLGVVALAALVLAIAKLHPVVVLLIGGALSGAWHLFSRMRAEGNEAGGWFVWLPQAAAGLGAVAAPLTLGAILGVFVKIGAVTFGSGYVLLAFLRAELLERRGWLNSQQLLDAVAVGQFTPGPVFTTATFIGYLLHGVSGAVVATVGIFLPAFFFVAISAPIIPRLRRSKLAGAVLDGINVASLALMALVTFQLAQAALLEWFTVAIGAVSALLLFRWKVNSAWLIAAAGLLGIFAYPHLH
jgi:chromate transporter